MSDESPMPEQHFIPGIYNYCDRWCERCPFTSRCMSYSMTPDIASLGESEADNEKFWDQIDSTFQSTLEMLDAVAKERGWTSPGWDEEIPAAMARRNRELEPLGRNTLTRRAESYASAVDEWFSSELNAFQQQQDELNALVQMGIEQSKPYEKAAAIEDAIEVIRWYQYQIQVKLMRGLSRLECASGNDPDDDARGEGPSDSDGSAKVALVGIDRSIGAWGSLYEQFPDKGDGIISTLATLDQLRRETEEAFPNARRFERPGFDGLSKDP